MRYFLKFALILMWPLQLDDDDDDGREKNTMAFGAICRYLASQRLRRPSPLRDERALTSVGKFARPACLGQGKCRRLSCSCCCSSVRAKVPLAVRVVCCRPSFSSSCCSSSCYGLSFACWRLRSDCLCASNVPYQNAQVFPLDENTKISTILFLFIFSHMYMFDLFGLYQSLCRQLLASLSHISHNQTYTLRPRHLERHTHIARISNK